MSSLKQEFEAITSQRDELVGSAGGEWLLAKKIDERLAKKMREGVAGAKDPAAAAGKVAGALIAEAGAKALTLPLEHETRLPGNPDQWREFFAACDRDILAVDPLDVARLPGAIRTARERWLTPSTRSTDVGLLVLSKVHGTIHHWLLEFDPGTNPGALDALCTRLGAPKAPDFSPAVIGHLVDLHDECVASDRSNLADAVRKIDALLLEYLTRLDRSFASATATDPYLDAVAVSALARASDGTRFDGSIAKAGDDVRRDYLAATQRATSKWWNGRGADDEAAAADHLVRLFASLRLAAESMKDLANRPTFGDWIAGLDEVTAIHVRAHRDRLLRAWDVDPDAFLPGPLRSAGERATDLVGEAELRERQLRLDETKLRRLGRDLADTEQLEPRLAKTVPELKKLLSALDPPQPAALADKPVARWLRDDFAKAVERVDEDVRDQRHDFVKKWCAVDPKYRERPDPATDVGGYYVANVLAALDRRLLRDILNDNDRLTWRQQILDLDPSESSVPFSTLESWLNRPGRLDQVAASFNLRGKDRSIKPKPDELTEETRLAWETYDFLERLQAFLLGDKFQTIRDSTIRCTLKPDLEQQGTVWWPNDGQTRVLWFGVGTTSTYTPQTIQGFSIDGSIRRNPGRAEKSIVWSCAPGASPDLRLGWNSAVEPPTDTIVNDERERYIESFSGPLGLLHFAWKGRPADATAIAGTEWRVPIVLRYRGRPDLAAPFKVVFDTPLPRRPASVEQYWSR
jgi:hypothetical protein